MADEKVPVGERALAQRINRKLRHDDKALRKARGSWVHDLGDYYIIDVKRNVLLYSNCGLESLGQELGILKPWEKVVWSD